MRLSAARVVLAALVLAAGTAACGGGGKDNADKKQDGGAQTTDTTIGEGFGPSGTDQNGTPTTAKPGAATATTKPGSKPRMAGVPGTGRYLYRSGPGPDDMQALDLLENPEADGVLTQMETWTDRSTIRRRVVHWKADSKAHDREQSAAPDSRGQPAPGPLCDLTPDLLDLKRPPTVGAEWSGTATCDQDGRQKERTITAKVTATDTITVEGVAVPVVVIERTIVDRTQLEIGPAVTRTVSTEFFSHEHGLIVRTRTTVERDVAGQKSSSQVNLELQSLKPSPPPTQSSQ